MMKVVLPLIAIFMMILDAARASPNLQSLPEDVLGRIVDLSRRGSLGSLMLVSKDMRVTVESASKRKYQAFYRLQESDPDCVFGSLALKEMSASSYPNAFSFYASMFSNERVVALLSTPCFRYRNRSPMTIALDSDNARFIQAAYDFGFHQPLTSLIDYNNFFPAVKSLYHASIELFDALKTENFPQIGNMLRNRHKLLYTINIVPGACSLLFEAIDKQKFLLFEYFIRSNIYLNTFKYGRTALMESIERKLPAFASALIKAGIDVKLRDRRGQTALHYAAKFGDLETTKLLIQSGSHLETRDVRGDTALILAALNRRKKVFQVLMEAYFTRYIKQSDDKQKEENTFAKRLTMVGLKQRSGDSGMAYYMLYQAYSPDSMNFEHINMELKRAAIFRDMDLFKFLMHTQPRLGYRYNYRGHHWTLLQLAVYLGHDEFLIPLLRSGINVHSRDKSGKTALHLAAEKENVEACRILVDFGANIEEGGSNSSPFKLAMESKNPQLIQLFVNLRYRPMVPVWLLKNAKLTSKQIESLIASLDTTSRLGLLTHSISQHRSNIVKKLVEMNPSFVGMKMNAKTSLLHLAAHLNNVDAARILLDAGARIDAKDSLGSRPLHIAAMHGYLDAARLLVDSGANMRTTDSRRRTPVMVAHSNDHYEVERYLRVEGNKFGKFLSCIR